MGDAAAFTTRNLIYLELNQLVYCNSFSQGGQGCSVGSDVVRTWTNRSTLKQVDRDLDEAGYRIHDLTVWREPELSDRAVSEEELERELRAVTVIDTRRDAELTAQVQLITTTVVIFVILGGISLVTKDLTILSRNLLEPLVQLAEEMESITRLQLAGIETHDGVVITVLVRNVEYFALCTAPALRTRFTAAVRDAVAKCSGDLPHDLVQVTLSHSRKVSARTDGLWVANLTHVGAMKHPVGVLATVTVSPPKDVDHEMLMRRLGQTTLISETVTRHLGLVADLAYNPRQAVRVVEVSAPRDAADFGHGTSEVRLIRRNFDNLKRAIKSWGKYVPWPVVQLLLRKDAEVNIDVTERDVSMFFSDIASFTTMVESMPPEESLLMLSRYFHEMSRVIDDNGGIVVEYIGDAIFAIFGAPVRNADHATAAVKAASQMLAALDSLNRWTRDKGMPHIGVRCGVHTGNVLVGNMGIQTRMKYGVVGEESNIPGMLEELNKSYSTKLLISHETFLRHRPDMFIVRPIDYVHLSENEGAASSLIYQVMGRDHHDSASDQKRRIAALHSIAMGAYQKQDFEHAEKALRSVHDSMEAASGEEDVPSGLLLKRCKHYMENPPSPNWDGVWDRGNVV